MANIASARKRARKSAASAKRNTTQRSAMRSAVRKVEEAIAAGNVEDAKKAFPAVQSALARGGRTGLIHSANASRKTARLNAKIKALATAT